MKVRMLCVAVIGAAVFAAGASAKTAATPFYAYNLNDIGVTLAFSGFTQAQARSLTGSGPVTRVYSNAGTMRCGFSMNAAPLHILAVFSHASLEGRTFCTMLKARSVGLLTQIR